MTPCLCSHGKSSHYRDRSGRALCANLSCGCTTYRPDDRAVPRMYGLEVDLCPGGCGRKIPGDWDRCTECLLDGGAA